MKYATRFLTKGELKTPIEIIHDNSAGSKHRLAVEILVEILRLNRHLVICKPDFTLQVCDVYDQTTNIMYELETSNISVKKKKSLQNTVVIPIGEVKEERKEIMKYIFEFLKFGKVKCI